MLPLFPINSYAKIVERMNGIAFQDYKDFDKKWKIITVRYRKDNQEIRIVYANPIAAKAMEQKLKVYPEGSIFAKIAYLSEPDPAFESSLAPAQSRRYQFMVKDSKKYKEHNNWGYALFDSFGKVNPEPEKDQVNACASCHNIVPERDYVFSWQFNHAPIKPLQDFKFKFITFPRKKLPATIAKHLPKTYKEILNIQNELTKNVFQGTLDEIKPALAKISVTQKKPVLFMSQDMNRFTLVYPEDLSIECNDEGAKGLFLVSVNSLLNQEVNKIHFCQGY